MLKIILNIIRVCKAHKMLHSFHRKLRSHGWKREMGVYVDYHCYRKIIGHRTFTVKLPKSVLSETFEKDIEKSLKAAWEAITYYGIKDTMIRKIIQNMDSDMLPDKAFDNYVKDHPFNMDNYKMNKGKE